MEPPVSVKLPGLRGATARILAYWADRDIQQREWFQVQRVQPFWDTLWEHLGDIEDYFGPPKPIESRIGAVLADQSEARRLQSTLDCIDRFGDLNDVSLDRPETFFDLPLWHQVNKMSQSALNLIVMDGGCWIEGGEIAGDDEDLVSEYPLRALAARCLASLADHGADDLNEQPPLRRDFADATTTLVDRCALSDPQSTIGRIYCDGDEIPRLQRLHEAIRRDSPKDEIAVLAGHALTAVVRAWGGWNYDGPIDAPTAGTAGQ